jgi:hypothetical protein
MIEEEEEERGVFQFAETVEADVWADKTSVEAMHVSLLSFLHSSTFSSLLFKDRISLMARKVIPLKRSRVDNSPSQAQHEVNISASPRRYTVISHAKPKESPHRQSKTPTSPPIVRSAKELKAEREREMTKGFDTDVFTMYEAVPVGADVRNGRGGKELMLEDDPEMASFLPMLQEYLRGLSFGFHSHLPSIYSTIFLP